MAADKNKKIISSIKLDSPIHGSPVAANGVLYIATMKKLYAVKKNEEWTAWKSFAKSRLGILWKEKIVPHFREDKLLIFSFQT